MGYNRWIPERSAPLALTTLKSLNAEIKQLEAQKKLVEKRDGEVPKALAVLQKYAKVLSPAQRRQVAKLIGETIDAKPARAAKAAPGPRKGRKLGKVAPKFASQPVRRGLVGVWPPRPSPRGPSPPRARRGLRPTRAVSSRRLMGR